MWRILSSWLTIVCLLWKKQKNCMCADSLVWSHRFAIGHFHLRLLLSFSWHTFPADGFRGIQSWTVCSRSWPIQVLDSNGFPWFLWDFQLQRLRGYIYRPKLRPNRLVWRLIESCTEVFDIRSNLCCDRCRRLFCRNLLSPLQILTLSGE